MHNKIKAALQDSQGSQRGVTFELGFGEEEVKWIFVSYSSWLLPIE